MKWRMPATKKCLNQDCWGLLPPTEPPLRLLFFLPAPVLQALDFLSESSNVSLHLAAVCGEAVDSVHHLAGPAPARLVRLRRDLARARRLDAGLVDPARERRHRSLLILAGGAAQPLHLRLQPLDLRAHLRHFFCEDVELVVEEVDAVRLLEAADARAQLLYLVLEAPDVDVHLVVVGDDQVRLLVRRGRPELGLGWHERRRVRLADRVERLRGHLRGLAARVVRRHRSVHRLAQRLWRVLDRPVQLGLGAHRAGLLECSNVLFEGVVFLNKLFHFLWEFIEFYFIFVWSAKKGFFWCYWRELYFSLVERLGWLLCTLCRIRELKNYICWWLIGRIERLRNYLGDSGWNC